MKDKDPGDKNSPHGHPPEGEWDRSWLQVQTAKGVAYLNTGPLDGMRAFQSPESDKRAVGKECEVWRIIFSGYSFRFSGRFYRRGSWLEVVTSCQIFISDFHNL